jgi:hypothetical protein
MTKSTQQKLFWTILLILPFAVAELISALALRGLIKPIEIKMGLPSPKEGSVPLNYQPPHPYKAYMYPPGGKYWVKGATKLTTGGHTYDYGLFQDGVVFDAFGHGVLPEDEGLSTRAKEPGEYRIMYLGGSTTFQPWPFLTSSLVARARGINVKTIGAAAGGYTSQENVADLVTCGSAYDADMIVAYLPINDIYYPARYPNFKRDYTHFRTPVVRVIDRTAMPDRSSILAWPFSAKLIQTVLFNKKMREYVPKINAIDAVTVKPTPDELGIWLDKESFEGTVDAVIDNIFTMKTYAESRGKRFVLITQKIFKTEEQFYDFIDPYVLEAIERIKKSPRLGGTTIIEMNRLFPEPINEAAITRVKRDFPDVELDFMQPQAYDSMHFSPASLYVFASIVAEQLSPLVPSAPF